MLAEQQDVARSISVTYKYIDGAHFFVSQDKEIVGLCVANKDFYIAYAEVALQLQALYMFNHGVSRFFKPAMDPDKFKRIVDSIRLTTENLDSDGFVTPASIQPWIFNDFHKASAKCLE